MGPGAWENAVPPETRRIMVQNAPTFLDELRDPSANTVDQDGLATVELRLRLTSGSESPPVLARVCERLAELVSGARSETIEGVGHVPQLTAPERYVEATTRAVEPSPV